MATQTSTKERVQTEAPQQKQEVAVFEPPRLPWHPAIEERFGVDKGQWKVLVESIFPAAKTPDSIAMALAYCKARNLDPFKRPVHIVPMWSSQKRGYVETVWPGISELRTTAFRTGNYAGADEAEFGPDITETFTGRVKLKEGWEDVNATVTFPGWCRITVYRALGGHICKFVGPKVYWVESYATRGPSDVPNEMWETRPRGQLEKCAEAAALRKAFPEEIGNELTAEEMSGRVIDPAPMKDVTPAPERPTRGAVAKEEAPASEAIASDQEPTEEDQQAAAEAQRAMDAEYAAMMGGRAVDPDPEEVPMPEPAEESRQEPAPKAKGKGKSIRLYWPDGATRDFDNMPAYRDAIKAAIRNNKKVWSDTRNQETLQKLRDLDPKKYEPMIDEIESVLAEDIQEAN